MLKNDLVPCEKQCHEICRQNSKTLLSLKDLEKVTHSIMLLSSTLSDPRLNGLFDNKNTTLQLLLTPYQSVRAITETYLTG